VLALAWLAGKGVSHRVIYILGGLLLFGSMQNFYFLLPMLFVGQIEKEQFPSRGFLKLVWSHTMYWVAGAVLGFLVALLAVYLLIGQVGIVPAEWRKTMPVHDLHDLGRNIGYSLGCLRQEAHNLVTLMTRRNHVYLAGLAVLVVLRIKSWRTELRRAIVLVAVGVSFFAFSVPLAPVIETRSLVALSIALIVLTLVPSDSHRITRWISVILLIWAGWNMSIDAHAFMAEQKEQNEFVLNKVENVLPHDPSSYTAIALFGSTDSKSADAVIMNNPTLMRAVVLSSGAPEFWDCQTNSSPCDQLKAKLDFNSKRTDDGMEFVGSYNGVGAISVGH
jgi:hypothetical protein